MQPFVAYALVAMSGCEQSAEATPARAAPGLPAGPPPVIAGYSGFTAIGTGGFSRVYRAHQEAYDRTVAVKVLSDALDDEVRRAFVRERALTGRLTGHPHVVTVLDSGVTESGQAFLTTAYYGAGSLTQVLAVSGVLPIPDGVSIGIKIAGALETAHRCGIHHRDVKPQNILLSDFGEPALSDFGISTALLDRLGGTVTTSAVTMMHAPPEVLEGDVEGPTADVYSLASTLFYVLAGRPAFSAENASTGRAGVARLVQRILSEPVPPLDRPDAPTELIDTLRLAMAKDPTRRFDSALAFAEALQAIEVQCSYPATAVICTPLGAEQSTNHSTQGQTDVGAAGPPAPPSPLRLVVELDPEDAPIDLEITAPRRRQRH